MLDFEKNINQHLGFVNNSDKFESLVTEYISDSPPSIKENADFKVIKDKYKANKINKIRHKI